MIHKLINFYSPNNYSKQINLDTMPNSILICSCEVKINKAPKRLSLLAANNKKAFENEFKQWLEDIESDYKNYDVPVNNKIS